MDEIGIRELKSRASEIVRRVREERARYTVTYRGHAVGLLTPMPAEGPEPQDDDEIWRELEDLGRQIGEGWASSQTGVELLSEMRR